MSAYFNKVEIGDSVFGLVYGPGTVSKIMVDGFYEFMVTYKNGYEVPYCRSGIPGWGSLDIQTVFYKTDIDLATLDLTPSDKVLDPKKIIKLRSKGKLMAKMPSGVWMNIKEVPGSIIEKYLESEKFHLFKKEI